MIESVNGKPVVHRGKAKYNTMKLRYVFRKAGFRRKDSDISEDFFGAAINAYFEAVIDYLVKYNKYKLPNGLGTFVLRKVDTTPVYDMKKDIVAAFRYIDRKATNELWASDLNTMKQGLVVYKKLQKYIFSLIFCGYDSYIHKSQLRFTRFKISRNLRNVFKDLVLSGLVNSIYKKYRYYDEQH